jgi:putative membrane protein insertion efficiency factor
MLARLLILIVTIYQRTLSGWLGGGCRFEPSCSRYAVACLEAHGALRGGLLSIVRLCKCHPFHPGGHDPPPLSTRPISIRWSTHESDRAKPREAD